MAIVVTVIDPNDAIANGPTVLNQNFSTIKTHIDDLENLLNPTNNSLKLTNLATIPANSIEAATMALSGTSGNVFAVVPNGGAAVATLDSVGVLTVFKLLTTATGPSNKSVLQNLQVLGQADFDAVTNLNSLVTMMGANSRIATKYRTVVLTNANVGSAATTPIDISKDNILFLDYSAVSLTSGIKFDLSAVVDGQEFTLFLLRNAGGGTQALYNGTTGNEIYSYLNPTSGFVTVSSVVEPTFTPSSSPNELSYVRLKYMNIGGGVFRLVVLEALRMTSLA